MATFKVPQHLPQDLLLISEFVDTPEVQPQLQPQDKTEDEDDDIASSGSEVGSEDEVEKDLTVLQEEDEDSGAGKPPSPDSSSYSESESSDSGSDSESESEVEGSSRVAKPRAPSLDADDDEDTAPVATAYVQTKNEVLDTAIPIPDLEEVGPHEELEKVGEVLGIVDQIVIVKGLPSEHSNRGSERALDSDTLLVFDDRKVIGYVYETFGPTSQPFYQIRFNQAYPLNTDKIRIGREVFHVPRRSHFVFVNQLNHFRGSDASNVHDEEPGENELEFSDDEAEAAYRARFKRKRERTHSVSSSRQSTPIAALRDQDMMLESASSSSTPDEYGAHLLSRPAPIPYDDPYSDTFNKPEVPAVESHPHEAEEHSRPTSSRQRSFSHSGEIHGRGRGRGRGRGGGKRGTFGRGTHRSSFDDANTDVAGYDPRRPQESLPSPYSPSQASNPFDHTPNVMRTSWGYPNQGFVFEQSQNQPLYTFPDSSYQTLYAQPSTFVQPHINPRFASAFGFQMTASSSGNPQELPSITSTRRGHSWVPHRAEPNSDQVAPEEEKPGN